MDALPIQEQTGLPFASRNPGIIHTCGHDGHLATLLGTAQILKENQAALRGSVLLCFQSGQEIGLGAEQIVTRLKKIGNVKQVVGLHYMGEMDTGIISLQNGSVTAGISNFCIEVVGLGGHSARPDLIHNPIPAACEIVSRIMAIPSNYHAPFATCIISPCKIAGGASNNTIPNTCTVEGNLRFLTIKDGEEIMQTISTTAEKVALSYHCSVKLSHKKEMCPPTINDPISASFGRYIARKIGLEVQLPHTPNMGAENFSRFLLAFPGFLIFMGAKSKIAETSTKLHTEKYDIDEKAIPLGAEFLATYAYEYLTHFPQTNLLPKNDFEQFAYEIGRSILQNENQYSTPIISHKLIALQKKIEEQPILNDDELRNTLKVYIDTGGNASLAAKLLYIHRNTMKYRLKKLEEALHCNLHDEETRLLIKIALSF